ncbi:MAG: DUF4124 domain-containing protein [Methylococcales bacterium]
MKNLLLTLILLLPVLANAKIYKCTNKVTGKLEFSDVACPDNATKETLDIVENDYSSKKWIDIDSKIAAKKYQQSLTHQANRDAFEKAKQEDIARVERRNAERFRVFSSNKLAHEQHQADIRSLKQRTTMINAARIARHRY